MIAKELPAGSSFFIYIELKKSTQGEYLLKEFNSFHNQQEVEWDAQDS